MFSEAVSKDFKKKKFLYIKKLFTVESYHYYLKWGDLVWEMWKAEITLY